MRQALSLVILLFLSTSLNAQVQRFTISGTVEDASTGEKLIGASVYNGKTFQGTVTNVYGFYSITLPADSIQLVIKYLGYKPVIMNIALQKSETINIKLIPQNELGEVEVVSTQKIEESSQMSTIEIPIQQIKNIPALLGEVDVLKVLQLLPGVQSGGEGSSGFYVRGGGPDQNLILLDGAPVYNASHLFGFFSVFNADAIKNVELVKGGFPARYGGRLSSVLEINMKEGNMKEYHGEGGVGIISSRLTVEGPIKKDTASFLLSARRTYIDILARPFIKMAADGNYGGYYFYDLNAKVNWKVAPKDHIYLSAYMGNDKFYVNQESKYISGGVTYRYKNEYDLGWGNITSTFRWNHLFTDKIFANTSLTYSRFNFFIRALQENTQTGSGGSTTEKYTLKYLSGINDYSAKIDFDYLPHPNHYIKFGVSNIYHIFNTGALQYQYATIDTSLGVKDIFANETGAYIEDDFKIGRKLKMNAGIRFAGFFVKKKFYPSFEPRASARYLIKDKWAVKGSYALMTQYIHLLTNSGIGLPTDLWVPSTDIVKPERSQQVATGVAHTLKGNQYEISVEGYYKWMDNIIDYVDGANFLDPNKDWQKKVESGKGWSYGGELFIQRKEGRFTGWVGYTLSWTNRQFPNINEGKVFPYKYDRRHDFEIVGSYKINDNIDISATWVYGTGNAISLPIAEYKSLHSYESIYYSFTPMIEYYGEKNSFRMAAYHRFDIGANFRKKKSLGKLKWERTWNVSVYNLYNRKNPYFIYFGYDQLGHKVARQVSLFPIIPSISYNFVF
jgi:outer membrane receptor for ferrienterochelin and colicin